MNQTAWGQNRANRTGLDQECHASGVAPPGHEDTRIGKQRRGAAAVPEALDWGDNWTEGPETGTRSINALRAPCRLGSAVVTSFLFLALLSPSFGL